MLFKTDSKPKNEICYQHSISDAAHVLPFDPVVTCQQIPMITTFQQVYFYTDSFDEAKEQMR